MILHNSLIRFYIYTLYNLSILIMILYNSLIRSYIYTLNHDTL